MAVVVQAILIGLFIALVGTIPRNLLFAANVRFHPEFPWAIPVVFLYLLVFWSYLRGAGPPEASARARRASLRANSLPARLWCWSLFAGTLGIVVLVLAMNILNQLIDLPSQRVQELDQLPPATALALLLAAAPIAAMIEEAAFRGYMQSAIERQHGLVAAILVTGTVFAVAHLDFRIVLWPYYLAVAALYGVVTYHTNSILPAIVLHTGGNWYSNLDLWRTGRAEWQAGSSPGTLIWNSDPSAGFWAAIAALLMLSLATLWAYAKLAEAARDLHAYANAD